MPKMRRSASGERKERQTKSERERKAKTADVRAIKSFDTIYFSALFFAFLPSLANSFLFRVFKFVFLLADRTDANNKTVFLFPSFVWQLFCAS